MARRETVQQIYAAFGRGDVPAIAGGAGREAISRSCVLEGCIVCIMSSSGQQGAIPGEERLPLRTNGSGAARAPRGRDERLKSRASASGPR